MAEQSSEEASIEKKIPNPLSTSRDSFEKLSSWGLAISAGTLLWFVGNFYKFIIPVSTSSDMAFMPHKTIYIIATICFSLSALIFAITCAVLYYTQYELNTARELFNNVLEKINSKEKAHSMALRFGDQEDKEYQKEMDDLEVLLVQRLTKLNCELDEANKLSSSSYAEYIILSSILLYILGLCVGSIYLVTFIFLYY